MENLLLLLVQSVGVYFLIIICLRFLGKKGLAELSVPDLVLIILIGEAINSLIPDDQRFSGTVVYIITLTAANYLTEHLTFKSKQFRKFMEGSPVTLIKDGILMESNLKKEKLTIDNLSEAIRSKGLIEIEEVELAIIETDGVISIIPKRNRQWKIKKK